MSIPQAVRQQYKVLNSKVQSYIRDQIAVRAFGTIMGVPDLHWHGFTHPFPSKAAFQELGVPKFHWFCFGLPKVRL